jgi:hypothetical protein
VNRPYTSIFRPVSRNCSRIFHFLKQVPEREAVRETDRFRAGSQRQFGPAKGLEFDATAVVALRVVSAVVPVVSGIVGLLWTPLTTVVTLAVVGALLYREGDDGRSPGRRSNAPGHSPGHARGGLDRPGEGDAVSETRPDDTRDTNWKPAGPGRPFRDRHEHVGGDRK